MEKTTDTNNAMELLQENFVSAFEELANAAFEFGKCLYNALLATAELCAKIINKFVNTCCPKALYAFSSKRVVHLASYAKKKRTRKKNYNRMIKDFYKNIERVMK